MSVPQKQRCRELPTILWQPLVLLLPFGPKDISLGDFYRGVRARGLGAFHLLQEDFHQLFLASQILA